MNEKEKRFVREATRQAQGIIDYCRDEGHLVGTEAAAWRALEIADTQLGTQITCAIVDGAGGDDYVVSLIVNGLE